MGKEYNNVVKVPLSGSNSKLYPVMNTTETVYTLSHFYIESPVSGVLDMCSMENPIIVPIVLPSKISSLLLPQGLGFKQGFTVSFIAAGSQRLQSPRSK